MRTEVIVIRHKTETCANLSAWMKQRGAEVFREDDNLGLIEATVPNEILSQLSKLPCVSYVRPVFKYETYPDSYGEQEAVPEAV